MQSSIYRSVLVATAGSACLLVTQSALAQAVTAGAETDTLQEVIVTATKRAENLQTVPLSVAVVSQERLQSQNLADTYDLQRVVPGLQYNHNTTPGNEAFGIRGVATQAIGPGLEQSAGVAFDGVPLGRNVGSLADLVDLQRVEVLKGPQGMLFGKNASAGLINIVTNTPDLGKTEEIFRVSYGTLNNRQYSGTVNLPISDSAAFRLSAWKFQHDGTTHEVNTGQDMNDKNSQGARLKFRLKPTDNLDLNFTGDWNSHHQNGTGYTIRSFIPANFTTGPAGNSGALIQAWELSHGTVPSDTNTTARGPNVPYFDVGHTDAYTGQADYSVGEGTLTALVSYRDITSDNSFDPYPSDNPYNDEFKNEDAVKYDQLSEEIRYASPTTERLKYVVGLFNFRMKLRDDLGIGFTPPPGINDNFHEDVHNTNYAAFGEATFDITSQLHFIAGLRRSTDKVDVGMVRTLAPGTPTIPFVNTPGSAFAPFAASTTTSYNDLSWRTGLQFQLAPDAMLYATASKGYKGPAIGYTLTTSASDLAASNNGVVKPEIAHAFEVGLKSQWLDRRLTTNVAVYEEIFDDFQTVIVLPGGFSSAVENARQLKSTGVDLDVNWLVTSDFSLTGSATYDHARFTDFTNASCYTGQTAATGCVNNVQNLNGHRLGNTPKTTTNLTARYEHPISSAWRGFLQANHSYRSDVSYSNAGDPYARQGGYSLVNLNAGVNTSDGRWGVSIYANNVFDKHYVDVVSANQGNTPFVLNIIGIQDMRTVGVAVNVRL